jgi:hypothetical protein
MPMVPYKPEARSAGESRGKFVYTICGCALLWIVLDHADALPRGSLGYAAGPGNRSLFNVIDDMTEGTRLPVLMFLAALCVERGFNAGVRSFISKRISQPAGPSGFASLATLLLPHPRRASTAIG